ncbi:CPBP family glutamic-type intramembrane protease [Larkinella sp. GY13]|uniref:CPBP family glutamic-type intramembrane protease n=1 Tax=Larkinella sp. GY13 TaxID=3453720 RepID=UPI003EEA8440
MKKFAYTTALYFGNRWVDKLKSVTVGFFLHYFFTLISVILILVVDKVFLPLISVNSILENHHESSSLLEEYGVIIGAIIVTLIGPLIEEISFRLILNPTKKNIIISSTIFFFLISGPVWYLSTFPTIRLLICFFIFIFFYTFSDFFNDKLLRLNKFFLLAISSFGFALFHIFNFSNFHFILLPIYLIYVLPQFFLGVILGIIRLKNGFLWSVLLHILINGSVTWPKLFTHG